MDSPYDFLLMYLSEKGHGPWSDFLKGINVLEIEEPAFSVARRLCLLAHLDFDYLTGEKSWNMTTPELLENSQAGSMFQAVLIGKRNPELLAALQKEAEAQGASIRITKQNYAPAVVEVVTKCESSLAFVANHIGINFMRQPAWVICLTLPPLDTQVFHMLKEPGVFGEVDAFDFDRLRWKRLKREEQGSVTEGVYRYGPPFNKSHTLCEAGQFYRVESEAAIWWRLKHIGRNVMRYHTVRQELHTPFFIDLPILWARALVLASGFLPETRSSWRIYQNISANLARLVADQMGQRLEVFCD